MAPHPLLTHAVEQTARSLDIPLAVLGDMEHEQDLAYGLRGFVADLHSAGAAVDFSVLYPSGRLVDAPLPTWTRRRLWLTPEGQQSPASGGSAVSVHPLLGQHVRLPEEPVRHVWQAEVGTVAQPWLADHRVRDLVVFPAAAYCEMAVAAARTVVGEACEVLDINFERQLLLDEKTTVDAAAVVASPGVADFTVETQDLDGEGRRASAVLHVAVDEQPPAHDISSLRSANQNREDSGDLRKHLSERGREYGPAFSGLGVVRIGAGETRTVLAEVA
ncbi:hypothetical protein BST47_30120, partial [Mycolicibacterium tusciae]